jgi:hypothetical protein
MMRYLGIVATALVLVSGCSSPAPTEVSLPAPQNQVEPPVQDEPAEAPSEPEGEAWGELGEIVSLSKEGVSAHLERTDSGYRLYYASTTEGGQVVAVCDDALQCQAQTVLDRIADLTVVETGSGAKRGFWVEMNPDTKLKEIYTGEVSADGVTVSDRRSLGYSGEIQFGVPDSVTMPDGRVRIYWVVPGEGRASERIVSATSTDDTGVEFEMDDGYRLEGGWVDFEVLRASDQGWLAVMSSSPERLPDSPQGIFLARSTDGLQWEVNSENLAPLDMSYLDPTGVQNPDGSYTLVMSVAPNALGERAYTLAHTTLVIP